MDYTHSLLWLLSWPLLIGLSYGFIRLNLYILKDE